MAEELKPCPGCGYVGGLVHEKEWNTFTPPRKSSWVENVSCRCGFWAPIDVWNTRAESPELRAIRKAKSCLFDNKNKRLDDDTLCWVFAVIAVALQKEGVSADVVITVREATTMLAEAWNTRAESPELRAIKRAMETLDATIGTFDGTETGHGMSTAAGIIRGELKEQGVEIMTEPNKDNPDILPTRCENCQVDFHEDRDGDCNCPRQCSDCDKDICDVCSYGGLCKDCRELADRKLAWGNSGKALMGTPFSHDEIVSGLRLPPPPEQQ